VRLVLATVLAALAAACTPPQTPAPAGPPADAQPSAQMPAPRGDTVTVHALVAEPARYEGRTVVVRGRCLGWNGPALGTGPITRSDWQLGDGDEAVWVSGPYPAGCGGQGGGAVTVRAEVVVDTVTQRGTGERRVRAYLLSPAG
jgi:hypothetical protein